MRRRKTFIPYEITHYPARLPLTQREQSARPGLSSQRDLSTTRPINARRWRLYKRLDYQARRRRDSLPARCRALAPIAHERKKRTRRHVAIDCRRRDPPRLRRRNLLLLLRLRLRPAVSHAGALVRRVLLPASAAASAA